ncbi:MAG: class I tRNA ligase family protein, partial [Phycisphaeraceae bacterium]
ESRPDWCLSRQRAWGLPIPAFFPPQGVEGEPLLTQASVMAVADQVRRHGSDYWFTAAPAELLENYDPANDADAPEWVASSLKPQASGLKKSTDIFDVWFESGSSWHAVLQQRELGYPADLYLEGSDQHRGWFQLSLLPALGVTGQSPFKNVLTHGFMVDKDGRKMSKSLGNTLEVEDLLKHYGADVCRWWVSSLNTDNDIKVDESFIRLAGEEYRKVRNTIRFLLSNLGDFDPERDRTEADPASLDAWALDQLGVLVNTVRNAYENFSFRLAHTKLFDFCNETMSAIYLAAVKDRLYCDKPDSPRRRRTQTAMYGVADALIRLLAPFMPHTADEAWHALRQDEDACVHLELLPAERRTFQADPAWAPIIAARDEIWMTRLEQKRQQDKIDNPLDLGLKWNLPDDWKRVELNDLADLCGISRFIDESTGGEPQVVDLRSEPRCERSWKRDGTVKRRSNGGMLSDRDAEALGLE